MFWELHAVSFTRGDFAFHLTITSNFVQHVYGLNPLGWAVWLLVVSIPWGLLIGRSGPGNGQTVGMRALNIRIVADDGHELSAIRAMGRCIIQGGLWILFAVPGVIDVVWALFDRESRTLHDLICRTHVVRTEPARRTWSP